MQKADTCTQKTNFEQKRTKNVGWKQVSNSKVIFFKTNKQIKKQSERKKRKS